MISCAPDRALLELRNVRKFYGKGASEVRALDGIDARVDAGEVVAVIGPSGSGKSTCMNVLGCLDRPSSGEYLFCGTDVCKLSNDQLALLRRGYLGFVFQGFNLLARTSAVENVELPLIYRAVGAKERRRRALAALEVVGLSHRASHSPAELSGGQQQRVAIARAIVTEPKLLVADEPTGNLDTAHRDEIMNLLMDLNRMRKITIVVVTHEPEVAARCRRVLAFRDGRIERDEVSGANAS